MVGIDDAKKYAQDLPKLMMGGKKNKKLINSALMRIEEECCSEGFANKDKNKVEKIKKSEITFLEGYLWDEGDAKKAFDKAIIQSNKVAMSLSDKFCVDRHKTHFLNLVKNKLD